MKEIKEVLDKQKKESNGKKFGVHVNLYGSKGSGKTYKGKNITKECFKKPVIYYMTDDFNDLDVAIFKPNNYLEDLENFLKWVVQMAIKGNIDAVVFDEADLLFPANKPLSQTMAYIIDKHRHIGLSVVFITRRPQNLNTKIAEENHFEITFAIEGENIIRKLNGVRKGYGDMIATLTYKSYDYVFKELGKEPEIRHD